MENRLVTFLIAIVLALGGWNLKEVYSISKDIVLLKEKVSQIEIIDSTASRILRDLRSVTHILSSPEYKGGLE